MNYNYIFTKITHYIHKASKYEWNPLITWHRINTMAPQMNYNYTFTWFTHYIHKASKYEWNPFITWHRINTMANSKSSDEFRVQTLAITFSVSFHSSPFGMSGMICAGDCSCHHDALCGRWFVDSTCKSVVHSYSTWKTIWQNYHASRVACKDAVSQCNGSTTEMLFVPMSKNMMSLSTTSCVSENNCFTFNDRKPMPPGRTDSDTWK